VTFERERHLLGRHAAAIVRHFDAREPALGDADRDARGARIDRVLDQLLERGGRALHYLTRGDAVDERLRQAADRGHQAMLPRRRDHFEAGCAKLSHYRHKILAFGKASR
jgi:hypothetical protein